MDHDAVLELIRRDVTSDQYEAVRALWKAHSIAEDNRDIPGLMATLTEDCVYQLPQTGGRWEGHEGATQFYTQLLGAFPDIEFHLTNIVIGPQGVCEEARATATQQAAWQDRPAAHRATGGLHRGDLLSLGCGSPQVCGRDRLHPRARLVTHSSQTRGGTTS